MPHRFIQISDTTTPDGNNRDASTDADARPDNDGPVQSTSSATPHAPAGH